MIIFLYGKDSYRRGAKLREISEEYRKKNAALTVAEFDASEKNPANLSSEAGAQSLFGGKKLLIVRNIFPVGKDAEKDLKKTLEVFLKEDSVTLLIDSSESPIKAFDFLIAKPAISQEFPVLMGAQFETFIKSEAGKLGARLTPQLLRDIALAYNGDSWGAVTELQKVALRSGSYEIEGGGASIPEKQIFFAVSGIRKGVPQSLSVLERLLSQEDPARIFNLLAYQAGATLKPMFADYDVAVKSGRADYEAVLTDYILGV